MTNAKLIPILLLATLCPATEANAQQIFAGYDVFCGLPVVVASDPQIASARTDANGQKFIHVDPSAMANWTSSRMFTLAHECAHHLLGHSSAAGTVQRYYGGTREQELAADCWAARKLRSAGLLNDVTRTMVQQASQGHFAGAGYPSGVERASNIANCASTGSVPSSLPVCRVETTQCGHPAHRADTVACRHFVQAHAFDAVPCQHSCGGWPCHSAGDRIPCQHPVQAHQADAVACSHPAHPQGDARTVCR
jgi:hypothetical protein